VIDGAGGVLAAPVRRIRTALPGMSPLYALVGAGDLALHPLRQGVAAVRGELEPKLVRDRLVTSRRHVAGLQGRARAGARARRAAADRAYRDLAGCGRDLVGPVRGDQRPVEEVLERADQAMRRDRAARHRAPGRGPDATAQDKTKRRGRRPGR
jgi:hypothetical protein